MGRKLLFPLDSQGCRYSLSSRTRDARSLCPEQQGRRETCLRAFGLLQRAPPAGQGPSLCTTSFIPHSPGGHRVMSGSEMTHSQWKASGSPWAPATTLTPNSLHNSHRHCLRMPSPSGTELEHGTLEQIQTSSLLQLWCSGMRLAVDKLELFK